MAGPGPPTGTGVIAVQLLRNCSRSPFPALGIVFRGVCRYRRGVDVEDIAERFQNLLNAGMIARIVSELCLTADLDDSRVMQAGQMLAQGRLRYPKLLGQTVYILFAAGQMNADLQSLGVGELAEKIRMVDETLIFYGLV